jgi:hypothetical protein
LGFFKILLGFSLEKNSKRSENDMFLGYIKILQGFSFEKNSKAQ